MTKPGVDDRRRNRDLRIAGQPPQLLACRRVVAAGERRRLRDELRVAAGLEDRRRGPRRNLFARRPPLLCARVATSNAAMNEFFWMSHWTIDEVLPDDRRAAEAPLVVGVVEPAGVEHAEVLASTRACRRSRTRRGPRIRSHDHMTSVGDRRRGRLARLWMSLGLRDALMRHAIPEDLAGLLVERDADATSGRTCPRAARRHRRVRCGCRRSDRC